MKIEVNYVDTPAVKVDVKKVKYGDDYYAKIGKKGGKASTGSFKTVDGFASKAARIRWEKYRADKLTSVKKV